MSKPRPLPNNRAPVPVVQRARRICHQGHLALARASGLSMTEIAQRLELIVMGSPLSGILARDLVRCIQQKGQPA